MNPDTGGKKQHKSDTLRPARAAIELLERRICLSAVGLDRGTPAIDLLASPADSSGPASDAFTPSEISRAYSIAGIKFGSTAGTGAGQTVAIVDAFDDPNITADLAHFDAQFQLPGTTAGQISTFLRVVNQTGGSALPSVDHTNGSWEIEESMDVEWVHAIAPGAKILLVECNSTNFSDLIAGGVNYARNQPGVVAVSMSFAGGEAPADLPFDQYFTTPAHHAGVTFLAATGDTAPDAGYPAVSPRVLAVGGTTLSVSDQSGTYGAESAYPTEGGGISSYELQPGYQNSLVTQNRTFRTTPDVSFLGDLHNGVAVYDSYDWGAGGSWGDVAGSSLACQCWAGLIAIADQGRSAAKLNSLDGSTGTLPRLYNLPSSDFHDITSGNNGFAAQAGYDLASGLGSPIASKLVAGLIHDPAGPQVLSDSVAGVSVSRLTSASFTFSQAMNPKSFTIAGDIEKFTGPNASNLLHQITGYVWSNSNRTLQLKFNPLTANGTYALVLGPRVESSGSNKYLDQNFNGIAGDTGDIYTARFTLASSVGPNKFGYSAQATAYQDVALQAGAPGVTSILANTDDGSTPLDLGSNTFNFYGQAYSGLFVDSNGILTFNSGSPANTEYANDDLTSDPSQPTIAPLWDDWTTTRGSSEQVLYQFTNPTTSGQPQDLVIEWDAVQNQGAFALGSASPATFEVVLQLNTGAKAGNIIFDYANLNLGQSDFNNGASATVGISNGLVSSDRLLISLDNPNNPLVGTGKSILISG